MLTARSAMTILAHGFSEGDVRSKAMLSRYRALRRAALGLLICCCATSPALAQVNVQPKSSPPAPQAKPKPPQPSWVVTCANAQTGLDCRAMQAVQVGQGRVVVAVHVPPETNKPELLVLLPLGLYLPAGVVVQFGKEAAKRLTIESCETEGCIAKYLVSGAELDALQKGADLMLSIQTSNKTPIAFKVPALGFSAAFAKVTSR